LRISDFGLRIVKYGGLFLAATRSVAPTSNDPDMILNLLRKLNICNTDEPSAAYAATKMDGLTL
jgi:hypothetical protein